MPRRGWQQFDVPSGWVRVLRGPRPPSERWPVAHRPSSVGRGRSGHSKPTLPQVVSTRSVPQEFKPSRTPEVAVSEAVGEVKKLEAAIAALGENSVHAKGLQEALRIARARSTLPPVAERVESCKKFLDRARQRVVRAQDVIDKATAQKKIHEEEVAEGERRLAQLQAEASKPVEVHPQVSTLQSQIDALIRERDAGRSELESERRDKWMGAGPPRIEAIPPMPTDLQDLEGWLSDRNCDLRNAIEFGNAGLVGQIGALIGQGASQLGSLGRDAPMDGQSKSSLMSSLIDVAEAKRRCIAVASASGVQQ